MSDRLSDIRKRWEGLGPWYAVVNDLIGGWCVGTKNTRPSFGPGGDDVADMMGETEAKIVASAPDDIAYLLRLAEAGEALAEASTEYREAKGAWGYEYDRAGRELVANRVQRADTAHSVALAAWRQAREG